MAGNPKQKLKILYLKQFLESESDSEHGVTVEQIIAHLSSNENQYTPTLKCWGVSG
ncbi:MAG: hypothetical protein RR235_03010 [Oscillospiraceae bacterium]